MVKSILNQVYRSDEEGLLWSETLSRNVGPEAYVILEGKEFLYDNMGVKRGSCFVFYGNAKEPGGEMFYDDIYLRNDFVVGVSTSGLLTFWSREFDEPFFMGYVTNLELLTGTFLRDIDVLMTRYLYDPSDRYHLAFKKKLKEKFLFSRQVEAEAATDLQKSVIDRRMGISFRATMPERDDTFKKELPKYGWKKNDKFLKKLKLVEKKKAWEKVTDELSKTQVGDVVFLQLNPKRALKTSSATWKYLGRDGGVKSYLLDKLVPGFGYYLVYRNVASCESVSMNEPLIMLYDVDMNVIAGYWVSIDALYCRPEDEFIFDLKPRGSAYHYVNQKKDSTLFDSKVCNDISFQEEQVLFQVT